MIRIVESPREAFQGWSRVIPTDEKVAYIDLLLRAGFDTVEAGSMASPRLLPQLADTPEVLSRIDAAESKTHIMALALNLRGASILAEISSVTHIAYPFSISPSFQARNVNATVEESFETVRQITSLCRKSGKQAVIYIPMAFGNPYGDPWSLTMLSDFAGIVRVAGARIICLSNVSVEVPAETVGTAFSMLIPMFPDIEFGFHLHTGTGDGSDRIEAAFLAGCRRFDGVIGGHGGCPMTGGDLMANVATELLLQFATNHGETTGIDEDVFARALEINTQLTTHD